MSERAIAAIEVGCVAMIAVGVWAIYWPAALIVAGALMLVGTQGLSAARREVGE